MKKILLIFFIYCIVNSCNKQEDFIQDVYVNEFVDLSLPQYSEINITGNAVFIEGGVEGIIIFKDVGEILKYMIETAAMNHPQYAQKLTQFHQGLPFVDVAPLLF